MAFLDKLGEKITSGASAVSDSAKKVAETNKINAKITSYLAEVNARYTAMGRAVKLRLMDCWNFCSKTGSSAQRSTMMRK